MIFMNRKLEKFSLIMNASPSSQNPVVFFKENSVVSSIKNKIESEMKRERKFSQSKTE
jgi:hypothetical protein